MVDGFHKECDALTQNIYNFKTASECVMNCNNKRLEHELQEDFEKSLDKRDDLINNEIMERYRMRDMVVAKMNKLQNQLCDFLNALMNSSLDVHKQKRLQMLRVRQTEFEKESKELGAIETKTSRMLVEVENEIVMEELESKKRLKDLKMQFDYFLEFRRNLERHISADRQRTYEKQKVVAVESYHVVEVSFKCLIFN